MTNPVLAQRARTMIDLLNVDNSDLSSAPALQAFAQIARLEERYRQLHREGQAVYGHWLSDEPLAGGYANHGAMFECVPLPAYMVSRVEEQASRPGCPLSVDAEPPCE